MQYNGWRFVQTLGYSNHALGEGISRLNVALSGPDALLSRFNNMYAKFLLILFTSVAANANPSLADKDNVFVPKFSDRLHSTVTALHEKNLNTCKQTRLRLKDDPMGLIFNLYSQAVKKNDTHISLGSVEFQKLTAKKVVTNEVRLSVIPFFPVKLK